MLTLFSMKLKPLQKDLILIFHKQSSSFAEHSAIIWARSKSIIFWEGRRISLLIRRIFIRMYIKLFGTLYKWLFADYRNSFSSGGYERLLQPVPYFFAYHNAVHGVFRTLVSHRISLFLLVPSVVGLARHAQFLRPTIYNRPSTGGDPGATNTFLVLSIWFLQVITARIVPEILNFLPISLTGDFSLNVHRLLKRK